MDDRRKSATSAATPIEKDTQPTGQNSGETFIAYMDDSGATGDAASVAGEGRNTSSKALDRWFKKRQKNHGSPRLLDVPNEALVTNGGPLQLTGNITLVLEDGSVQYANHLSLCRCGNSAEKPNCDGQHLEREFLNPGKITEASEISASQRPSKITVSCVKDGPVTFRGRLRLHNQFGQECVKMRGSLCRCGQSANKPFCDGSHARTGFRTG